jgi:tetratricopeptide (TPR) repeat protein
MAMKRERPNRQKKTQAEASSAQTPPVPAPAAGELFGESTPGGPQYGDFFDPLFASASDPAWSNLDGASSTVLRPRRSWLPQTHLSGLQGILLVGIVCVAGFLAYTALQKAGPMPTVEQAPPPAPAPQQHPMDQSPQGPLVAKEEPAVREPAEASTARLEPLSLRIAETLYHNRDYDNAFVTYDKLYRRLPATEQNQPVRDFLLLRMALCSRNGGSVQQADGLFRTAALSRLPILRAIARYYQSITLIDRQRYLEEAARAYQTIALIEVVDADATWSAAVQRQCYFLVAEALTRNLLSLHDADGGMPAELWSGHPAIDPFVNPDEEPLKVLLNSGREALEQAMLSPQIRPIDGEGATPRWSVTCNGEPLEELLARVAGNARINVRWIDNGQTALDEEAGRKRPVHLHLTSATAQQIVTVAAGSVGLLARFDEEGNVSVLDPSYYSSLAEHTKLLTEESTSLWQQFLLGGEEDQRVANGHFALALLHAARDQVDEAVAEYKLVANRFSKHPLAPHALLRSGRLKVKLRDYMGAHEDFKQLIDLYPDGEFSDQACLELADTSMKAALHEEAADLYRKVFNMGLSRESQVESALGAGRCFYEMRDYEAAAQRLNRYIGLARDQNRAEFHGACLLLGKTYLALGNPQQAQVALNLALRGELSAQQHVETTSALVRTYVEQGLYVDALNLLEGTQAWQLSQQETVELLLLRAQVLRSIGLVEKAIAALEEKSALLPNPEFKGAVALELAECHAAKGDLPAATETLGKAFAAVGPGDLAQQIGGRLAEFCLQANQPEQVISVCSQLLNHAAGTQRERLLSLQAEAYRRQREYGRAVAALLSRHNSGVEPKSADPRVTPGAQGQQ